MTCNDCCIGPLESDAIKQDRTNDQSMMSTEQTMHPGIKRRACG